MSGTGPEWKALTSELGGTPPVEFAALPAASLASLASQLREARLRQKQQLDEALTRALEHVPALMRMPIRKVLGL
jgi:hypothetical protein